MKSRILALLVIAMLPLMGFDCITDAYTISLNLKPFNGTYAINPGPPTYTGSVTINPSSLYDESYTLTGASVYDIRVSTAGPSLGLCSGTVTVNGITLFTYSGQWTAFNTAQSLLTSRFITKNQAGINELVSAVLQKRTVILAVSGSVEAAPAATNTNWLTVSAYVQAYGHL